MVAYIAALKTVDYIVEGIDRSKSAMIVTSKADCVCKLLSNEFGCGITVMDAKGYYSDTKKQVVYIVVNRFQITKMKRIVHEADSEAYITINEVADIFIKET